MEDGIPIKCSCGCTDLKQTGQYYEGYCLVEYAVKCKLCGKQVRYWAYGSWDL